MLTPLDIHNKVFGRTFRGYKMEEVDAFLDEIIRDQEAFFRENTELKETVARMDEEAAKNREISATLEKTMVLAQKVYEEELIRAKKVADILMWEAQKKSEKIIEETQKEILDARQQIERLRLYEKQLYLKHKGFLEFQIELLDGYKDKETVLSDSDMEKLLSGGRERDFLTESSAGGKGLPDIVELQDAPKSAERQETEPAGDIQEPGKAWDAADIREVQDYTGTDTPDAAGIQGEEADAESGAAEESEERVFMILSPEAVGADSGIPPEYRSELYEQDADDDAPDEEADLVDIDHLTQDNAGAEEISETYEVREVRDIPEVNEEPEAVGDSFSAASGAAETVSIAEAEAQNWFTSAAGGQSAADSAGREEGGQNTAEAEADEDTNPPAQPNHIHYHSRDAEDSPFIVREQVKSMEQVVLLAQKMEEALKALDSIYGTDDADA